MLPEEELTEWASVCTHIFSFDRLTLFDLVFGVHNTQKEKKQEKKLEWETSRKDEEKKIAACRCDDERSLCQLRSLYLTKNKASRHEWIDKKNRRRRRSKQRSKWKDSIFYFTFSFLDKLSRCLCMCMLSGNFSS